MVAPPWDLKSSAAKIEQIGPLYRLTIIKIFHKHKTRIAEGDFKGGNKINLSK